jgi:hypothetical protein
MFKDFAKLVIEHVKANVPVLVKEEVSKIESSLLEKAISKERLDEAINSLKARITHLDESQLMIPKKGEKGDSIIGPKGDNGKDGNGINKIYIDQRGHLIVITDKKKYDLGVVTSGGGGGGSENFTYTNSLPMPASLGGFDAGTTFDHMSLKDLWTGLLYGYEPPVFTSFNISGIPVLLEVGDTIEGGSYNAYWVIKNSEQLKLNSIGITYINGSLDVANDLPNNSPQSIILPNISFVTATPVNFRIYAADTTERTFFYDFIVNFVSKIYVGESELSTLTEDDIKVLRLAELSDNINGQYELIGGGYKWFCYPVVMGTRNNFYDVDTNFPIAMDAYKITNVNNEFGIMEAYYCYRTFNTLGGDIKIGVM